MKKAKNILIVGLGGQGINALYYILQSALLKAGVSTKGAIFKGGAQKRGSVYAMIRIFGDDEIEEQFSPIIPAGELDVLIALEANEALRYSSFYNEKTTMIINDFTFSFYNERYKPRTTQNPIETLKEYFIKLYFVNYNSLSVSEFDTNKMVNVLAGLDAVKQELVPIDELSFLEIAQERLKISYEDMMILMKRMDEIN